MFAIAAVLAFVLLRNSIFYIPLLYTASFEIKGLCQSGLEQKLGLSYVCAHLCRRMCLKTQEAIYASVGHLFF